MGKIKIYFTDESVVAFPNITKEDFKDFGDKLDKYGSLRSETMYIPKENIQMILHTEEN